MNAKTSNRVNLASDPNPPKPPPPPAPALDLAVLLDISDECVVQRAFSHKGMFHYWDLNALYLCAHRNIQACLCNFLAPNKCGADTDAAAAAAAATTSQHTDKILYLAQVPQR